MLGKYSTTELHSLPQSQNGVFKMCSCNLHVVFFAGYGAFLTLSQWDDGFLKDSIVHTCCVIQMVTAMRNNALYLLHCHIPVT
jgi:hypothetical protein